MTRVLHRSGAIPPIAVRGEGIYLFTQDGKAVIDASGGAAVACLGHGNRRVAEAIGRQAAAMAYSHTGTFSNQPAEDLADIILDGAIQAIPPTPEELEGKDHLDLERIAFNFNRRDYGRLRQLIDVLNGL